MGLFTRATTPDVAASAEDRWEHARQEEVALRATCDTLEAERSAADHDLRAAQDALDEAQLDEVTGDGSREDVARAEAALTEARERRTRAGLALEVAERRLAVQREGLARLEPEGLRGRAARLTEAYRQAAAAMASALAAFVVATEDADRAWQEIETSFAHHDVARSRAGLSTHLGLPWLGWGEFAFDYYAPAGGLVGSWVEEAATLLGADHPALAPLRAWLARHKAEGDAREAVNQARLRALAGRP